MHDVMWIKKFNHSVLYFDVINTILMIYHHGEQYKEWDSLYEGPYSHGHQGFHQHYAFHDERRFLLILFLSGKILTTKRGLVISVLKKKFGVKF